MSRFIKADALLSVLNNHCQRFNEQLLFLVGWKLDNKNNSVFTLTIRWLCVAASLFFFIALLYQIVRKYNKNADYYIGRKEIMEFIKGSTASSSSEAGAEGSSEAESLPYQSNILEVPRSCFEIGINIVNKNKYFIT